MNIEFYENHHESLLITHIHQVFITSNHYFNQYLLTSNLYQSLSIGH